MKKANYWFSGVLWIISILTAIATYFNIVATPTLIVGICCSLFVGFVAMMQSYHYEEWHEDNPRTFWAFHAGIAAAIIVIFFFGAGVKIFDQEVAQPMVYCGIVAAIPGLGDFFGYAGKMLKS